MLYPVGRASALRPACLKFANEWSELSPLRPVNGLRHLGHHGGSEVPLCRRPNESFAAVQMVHAYRLFETLLPHDFSLPSSAQCAPRDLLASRAAPGCSPSGPLVAAASANFRLAASALAATPSQSRSGCWFFAGKPVVYLSPRGAIDLCSTTRRYLCLRRSEDRMLGRIGTFRPAAL